jgi:hypothetical protein
MSGFQEAATTGSPENLRQDSDRRPEVDVAEMSAKVNEILAPSRKAWLESRFEAGRYLNEMLGSPVERQKYGRGTLARIAANTKTDVAELNRARWMALAAESAADFRARYPEVVTTRDLKSLLPRIRQEVLATPVPSEALGESTTGSLLPTPKPKSKRKQKQKQAGTGPARECLRLLEQACRLTGGSQFAVDDRRKTSLAEAYRRLGRRLREIGVDLEERAAVKATPVEATVASPCTTPAVTEAA